MKKVLGLGNFLKKYDVVPLQETWVEKNKDEEWLSKLDKNYRWVMKAATREKEKGSAKGGVILGIKKNIEVESIKEWDYGIWARGIKTNETEQLSLIIVYNNVKI